MKGKFLSFAVVIFALVSCGNNPYVQWIEGAPAQDGKVVHELVLHNVPAGSRVWLARIPRSLEVLPGQLEIIQYKGNSYYLDIPEHEGKTISVKYYEAEPLPRKSWAPEGFVLQQGGKEDMELKAEYTFIDRVGTEPDAKWFTRTYEPLPADIIPAIKKVEYGTGKVAKPDASLAKIELPAQGETHPEGWYKISISEEGATITAAEEDGFFYAHKTYGMLPAQLPPVEIEDWPDLPYRGIMLDVARNFLPKKDMLELIDDLTRYKVNYLHIHIVDDEGWRYEIPRLPELTTYAARHALPVEKDGVLWEPDALMPGTDGRISQESLGTGYYSQADYEEIIKYAWERRIRVVPEVDAPGHSRAAIRAMEAYERRTGDSTYRLSNPLDSSKYTSAQNFNDNVLDVEYPGVYKFMEVVFDSFIEAHQRAGVPLPAIHIGGDEVPDGSWAGRSRLEMKDLFIRNMMEIASRKGVKLAGWQEITQGIKPETLKELIPHLMFVNAWSTRGEKIQIPYQLANAGVPTVLSNVGNLYIDLAYSDGPDERGLTWGGYLDERKSFALQPYKIYESVRWKDVDTPISLADAAKGKTELQRPENIIGVQVQLWSETLRSPGDFQYAIFPKAIGAFERGWNSRPCWPDDDSFAADWDKFYSILAQKEFPVYKEKGIKFKER